MDIYSFWWQNLFLIPWDGRADVKTPVDQQQFMKQSEQCLTRLAPRSEPLKSPSSPILMLAVNLSKSSTRLNALNSVGKKKKNSVGK